MADEVIILLSSLGLVHIYAGTAAHTFKWAAMPAIPALKRCMHLFKNRGAGAFAPMRFYCDSHIHKHAAFLDSESLWESQPPP